MEVFTKIVNGFSFLTTFAKSSILDVWQDSEFASEPSNYLWKKLHLRCLAGLEFTFVLIIFSRLLPQLLKSSWNRIRSLRCISMPLFLMPSTTKNYEITHERKFWTQEIPTRKNLKLTKYPRENILDPRNSHEGTMAQWH